MISKKDLMKSEGLLLLLAIAQNEGKRKASEVLNTSVDTINKYIGNLESDLGIKLLSSNGRGSMLTPAAYRLMEAAGNIKHILDEVGVLKSSSTEVSGEVRVSMVLGASANMVPKDVSNFFDDYPKVKLVSLSTDKMPNLSNMEADLAIVYDVPQNNDVVKLYEKTVKCGYFASPSYLSTYGYPIDLEDMLENHRVVMKVNEYNHLKGVDPMRRAKNVVFRSNISFALMEVIRNGLGIGVMPMRFNNEGFVCLDNIACDSTITFYMIGHKSTKDTPRIRTVINYYKSLMDKM